MSETSEKPVVLLPGPATEESSNAENLPERRFAPRYPFTAAAEVSELRSQTRITARSTDLGLGGCYVDAISPFGAGSVVRVRLERESRMLEAMARVTYAHESMGMGLVFTAIKPEYQTVLKTWIAELSGEIRSEPQTTPAIPDDGTYGLLNARPVLNELINLLVRKRVLSEVEGSFLLRQLFH